jgi:3-oxoacyl-[acyl-carrier protein] reductase
VQDARFSKMTEDQFDSVIDVNLKGVYNCTKAVVDIMLQQNSGCILNASSIVGLYGNFGQTNYAATKFGVIGFTKTWSRELGPKGIRVNAVAPGYMLSEMTRQFTDANPDLARQWTDAIPLGRMGQPQDLHGLVGFLASDASAYLTAQTIVIDGGYTAL